MVAAASPPSCLLTSPCPGPPQITTASLVIISRPRPELVDTPRSERVRAALCQEVWNQLICGQALDDRNTDARTHNRRKGSPSHRRQTKKRPGPHCARLLVNLSNSAQVANAMGAIGHLGPPRTTIAATQRERRTWGHLNISDTLGRPCPPIYIARQASDGIGVGPARRSDVLGPLHAVPPARNEAPRWVRVPPRRWHLERDVWVLW